MRVISMQGKEVWDLIRMNGVYHADALLTRESNDYSVDVQRLNGFTPIWCYHRMDINFYTMYDGVILDDLRLEMSLNPKNCWDDFVMFELEIPEDSLVGHTRNTSEWVRIIPEITLEMTVAVYTVRDANPNNPFYKIIKPIWLNESMLHDVITMCELNCEAVSEYAENSVECFEEGSMGKCLCCRTDTPYYTKGKHYCSVECMWEHRHRFLKIAKSMKIDKHAALNYYNSLTDSDFENGKLRTTARLRELLQCKVDGWVCNYVHRNVTHYLEREEI